MKFYLFGNPQKPVLFLLPGTCCHWKRNFGSVVPLLARDFRVVCVSYDGFDETENTEFSTMLEETEKIEAYIKEHCTLAGISERPTAAPWAAPLSVCCSSAGIFRLITPFWAALIWPRAADCPRGSGPNWSPMCCTVFSRRGSYLAGCRSAWKEAHEELLICHPEKWADEVRSCCEIKKE